MDGARTEDCDDEDVVGDNVDVCVLCCPRSNLGLSLCDKCQLMYGTDCIDTHTCNKLVLHNSACPFPTNLV